MSLLEVSGLSKTYTTRFGGAKVEALKSVTFSVESGEYVAVMGESGSGKTTLLNILAALDKPTGGEVVLDGRALGTIPEREIAARSSASCFRSSTSSTRSLCRITFSCRSCSQARRIRRWPRASHPSPGSSASRSCCRSSRMSSPADRSSV
mgnify:CR=1 FL=1